MTEINNQNILSKHELESFGFTANEKAVKIEFDYDQVVKYRLIGIKILITVGGLFGCISFMVKSYQQNWQYNANDRILISLMIGGFIFVYHMLKYVVESEVRANKAAISHDQIVFKKGGCTCCCGICFNESIKSVSLSKITDVSIKQNCCMKLCDIKGLSLDTASGCEGQLDGVKNILYVRKIIMRTKQVMKGNDNVPNHKSENDKLLLQLINKMDDVCNLLVDIKNELHASNANKSSDKSEFQML
eukprot:449242_1